MLTIACVCVGDGYTDQYVINLRNAVELHTSIPHKFVCFSDRDIEGVTCRRVPEGLNGWWAKMYLFNEAAFAHGTRVLYLDLDTLISGPLDDIASYDGEFAMLSDFYFPNRLASGVMAWEAGKNNDIWLDWEARGKPRPIRGDQEAIEAKRPDADRLQDLFPGKIISFKVNGGRVCPPETSIICFHGLPRPHQCGGWVSTIWNGTDLSESASVLKSITSQVQLSTETSPGQMVENVRINMARSLPRVISCRPHRTRLSIAAGGPSLADTYADLKEYVAAVNGSVGYLLDNGVVPNACGVLDPGSHMADVITADRRVRYFVASICDPAVFDKLIKSGCNVVIWHPSGHKEVEDCVKECDPDRWMTIGGPSTMGARWLNLGYVLGFRDFTFHGLDSSFSKDNTHAYPDRKDGCTPLTILGYPTRLNFLQQVQDFATVAPRFISGDDALDPCKIELKGEGLMQTSWKHWEATGAWM